MMQEAKWNNYQKLQAYVLADITRSARNNMASERAVLLSQSFAVAEGCERSVAEPVASNPCESVIWKSESMLYQEERCVSELEATLGKER
jgi:hypothetical protein